MLSNVFLRLLDGVKDEDLERAKRLSLINVLMGLERSSTRLEDNCRNLLN